MKTKTHSPGPWKVGEFEIHGECGGKCAVWSKHAPAGDKTPAIAYGPNAQANARLIAAAPDLLAACKAAESFIAMFHGERCERLFHTLSTVIANAEAPDAPEPR